MVLHIRVDTGRSPRPPFAAKSLILESYFEHFQPQLLVPAMTGHTRCSDIDLCQE